MKFNKYIIYESYIMNQKTLINLVTSRIVGENKKNNQTAKRGKRLGIRMIADMMNTDREAVEGMTRAYANVKS